MKERIMIGKVQYVDTGNVTINIERDEFVNSVQVNQIVQINSSKTKEKIIGLVTKILRKASPVDSYFTPIPCEFPGYPHKEIMAAGNFTQGSTIEFTGDGPVIPPYKIYMQGALTFEYGRLGILLALTELIK